MGVWKLNLIRFLIAGVVLVVPSFLFAQHSLDVRQFYFNPFLFNPAYAGLHEHAEFSIMHRRQWVDFEDAPVASGFSYRQGVSKNTGVGFIFQTHKTIALRTTVAQVAFAYRVPLGRKHALRFALAGGMSNDDLDLEGADYSNDPLILNAADNKIYLQGAFGMLYTWGNFRLGVTFPSLVNNQQTGTGVLETHAFEQLRDQIYSLRFRFPSDRSLISLEPYMLYRQYRDNQRYWDVGTLLHYNNQLCTGVGVHEFQGIAFMLGMTIKQTFKISYDYEFPAIRKNELSSVSHELHLSVILTDGRRNDKPARQKKH